MPFSFHERFQSLWLHYRSLRPLSLGSSNHPWRLAIRLLLGYGRTMTLPEPLPAPSELQSNEGLVWERYDGITVLRRMPFFTPHDTPTKSIYRMSEFICADQPNQLMLETVHFWRHASSSWRLDAVPDPRDDNRERSAVFASVVESLVLAFNYRYSLGLRRGPGEAYEKETCPSWTARVPPLDAPLMLQKDTEFLEFSHNDDPFSRRNITANAGNLFSI